MKRKVMFFGALLLGGFLQAQTVLNRQCPVFMDITNAQSSLNPADYTWGYPNNNLQGVTIYLPAATSPYIPEIYLQQSNARLAFSSSGTTDIFAKIEVSYDNGQFITVCSGASNCTQNFGWITPPSSFMTLGAHTLKVKYTSGTSQIHHRDYNVYVTQECTKFYRDNVTTNSNLFRNKLTLWEGANPSNQKAMLLVTGFDAYNTLSAEYYRYEGKELFDALLAKGYKIYVLTFAFNAQELARNAAVVHSAIEYVSSLNNNNKIVVAGMSMGGVISRYALTKDEETQNNLNSNNYLPVSHFVSIDAPQQGAIISTALLEFTHNNDASNYTFNTAGFKTLVKNNTKSSHA